MTATSLGNGTTLEDALYALAVAKASPDAEVLDEIVRRYPEFAAELTDMAVELALEALQRDPREASSGPVDVTGNAVLRAMSRFENKRHAVEVGRRGSPVEREDQDSDLFSALGTTEIRALGARLNANTVFVLKLRDRFIQADTITDGFKRRLAEELRAPVELVAAHFAGPSTIRPGAYYKADQKPHTTKKQSFEEAVRTCGLTQEQQIYLLSL